MLGVNSVLQHGGVTVNMVMIHSRKNEARRAVTTGPPVSASVITTSLLLKEFDDKVQLLLKSVDPLMQSIRLLPQFAQDRGFRRLGVKISATMSVARRVGTYHGGPGELLDKFGERHLTDYQSPLRILSGYPWVPRIWGTIVSDGCVYPLPQ